MISRQNDSNAVVNWKMSKFGATIGAWTRDLILTMDALYQLSYRGIAIRQSLVSATKRATIRLLDSSILDSYLATSA